MTPFEAEWSDREALADLMAAYAHAVDRRQIDDIVALFTDTGRLAIYDGQPGSAPPRTERFGRPAIATAMAVLDRFDTTTHFLGQQQVSIEGDRAHGETYCLAHHLSGAPPDRTVMVMSIRYLDQFARTPEGWRISERVLAVDWTETRRVA